MDRRIAPRTAGLLLILFFASGKPVPAGPAAGPESDAAFSAVRKAVDTTAAQPFAYTVDGRFKRTGTFRPPDLLTARIAAYRSARRGKRILVRGPEGLWRTPGEHLGETVRGGTPPKGLADMIRVLENAEPPQDLVRQLLDTAEMGRTESDVNARGVSCRTYSFAFPKARLRETIERQLEKERKRGDTPAPDEIRWGTLRGSLRVYVSRKDGVLVRAVESRSVRIVYQGSDRTYRNVLAIDFSGHGKAEPELPEGVRKRLGVQ